MDKLDEAMELAFRGEFEAAEKILGSGPAFELAPLLESAGDRHAGSNRDLAIWCYRQARACHEADAAGATSGGEGLARMMENPGAHLGRKIWKLL